MKIFEACPRIKRSKLIFARIKTFKTQFNYWRLEWKDRTHLTKLRCQTDLLNYSKVGWMMPLRHNYRNLMWCVCQLLLCRADLLRDTWNFYALMTMMGLLCGWQMKIQEKLKNWKIIHMQAWLFGGQSWTEPWELREKSKRQVKRFLTVCLKTYQGNGRYKHGLLINLKQLIQEKNWLTCLTIGKKNLEICRKGFVAIKNSRNYKKFQGL